MKVEFPLIFRTVRIAYPNESTPSLDKHLPDIEKYSYTIEESEPFIPLIIHIGEALHQCFQNWRHLDCQFYIASKEFKVSIFQTQSIK